MPFARARTLVDATSIASASKGDDEAHRVKYKGKPAVHGFKTHVGADADTALVEEIAALPVPGAGAKRQTGNSAPDPERTPKSGAQLDERASSHLTRQRDEVEANGNAVAFSAERVAQTQAEVFWSQTMALRAPTRLTRLQETPTVS